MVLFFCVFVLVFCNKAQKANSYNFRGFLFCFPERPGFKILILFLFCFGFWFSFCLAFQYSIFSLLFAHQPLSENIITFGFFVFIVLAFSFPNVCMFL